MNVLPRIVYRGREYIFDERLSELRDARYPWRRIPLNTTECYWIKITGHCPWPLRHS